MHEQCKRHRDMWGVFGAIVQTIGSRFRRLDHGFIGTIGDIYCRNKTVTIQQNI